MKTAAVVATPPNSQGDVFVSELGNDSQVKILVSSVKVTLNGADITASVGKAQAADGLGVVLTGVPNDATVRYLTVDAQGNTALHNRMLIENVDGNGFDIGGFGLVGPPAFTAIGQLIGFGDDGPAASIALTGNEAVTDESTGANASDTGLAAPNDEGALTPSLVPAAARLIGYDQANVVTTAGTGAGTDGGASSVTLELGANTDSGLTTTDGTAIALVKEGSIVVGRAAGEAIFAISINASGQVTVEQYDSIRHTPGRHLRRRRADRGRAAVRQGFGHRRRYRRGQPADRHRPEDRHGGRRAGRIARAQGGVPDCR